MKHFERLSRMVSLRTGIVVFAAIVGVLALSSASEVIAADYRTAIRGPDPAFGVTIAE